MPAARWRDALPASLPDAAHAGLVAAAYILAGKLGLSLASIHPSATAVWAPTGIAIAALLLGGKRLWIGVLVGAFVVNATTDGSLATALGIATGNTLEALAAAWLVGRLVPQGLVLGRAGNVFRYAAIAAAACAVSPTVGVASLAGAGFAAWSHFAAIWWTWWLGDLAGAIVVAPLLLAWVPAVRGLGWREARDLGALLAATVAVGALLFTLAPAPSGRVWPLEFLVIPVVVAAALWKGPLGATTSTVALSAIAVAGTVNGRGPFGAEPGNDALLLLQGFMAVVSLTGLALGTVVQERARIALELRRARDGLEVRITDRTDSLRSAVDALQLEVADHQRDVQELRQREAQLSQAQRIAGVGSWEWDVASDRVTWSDELYRMYGLKPQEFPASYQGFLDRVHPDDRDRIHGIVGASLQTGEPFSFHQRLVRPDGEVRHLRAAGEVIRDARGQAVRMVGIAQDTTEQQRAEEERRTAYEQGLENRRLHDMNQLKTDFINAAAHELNTPLTPILLQLRMLGDARVDEERRKRALTVMRRNVDRMALLVQDMLDVARLQSGRLRMGMATVQLSDVVEEVAATFQDLANERLVTLEVHVPPALQIEADATRLAQVLNNLVSNALKFTPPGGRATIRAEEVGDEVVVTVADTGQGLRPDLFERLFQPFSQVHDGADPKPVGTGLGLYISKGIVDQHGGRIWATSGGPGAGATFHVALPKRQVAQASDAQSSGAQP